MSDNELLNNYLRFINTSNQSLQSMLEIINNQQQSFNLLLERYNSNINVERNNRRSYHRYNPFFTNRNNNIWRFPNNFTVNLENLINEFNNDVLIRPTNEQIELATTRCQYCDIENPLNNSCPISQTEFNDDSEVIIINHCRHVFLPDQILHWFTTNVRCPLCRYDIRDNNIDNNINNNDDEPEIQINEASSLNNNINNTQSDRNQELLRNTLLNSFSQYLNQNDTSMNVAIDFYYMR